MTVAFLRQPFQKAQLCIYLHLIPMRTSVPHYLGTSPSRCRLIVSLCWQARRNFHEHTHCHYIIILSAGIVRSPILHTNCVTRSSVFGVNVCRSHGLAIKFTCDVTQCLIKSPETNSSLSLFLSRASVGGVRAERSVEKVLPLITASDLNYARSGAR